MYTELLESLGLAKNEAKIYEVLLTEGESPVGHIATKSKVHRRNVYDSLQRLIEKGLVFEILQSKENHYQAVNPKKLSEELQTKQNALSAALPTLEQLFQNKPAAEAVYIYRGIEGWKNYMRDILRKGQDDYVIGAKGVWADPKIKGFTEQFAKEARAKGIKFKVLFAHSAKNKAQPLIELLNAEHRYIPEEFETVSDLEIFGDQVVIISDDSGGTLRENLSLTVITNQKVADSFRTWFNFMWSVSHP